MGRSCAGDFQQAEFADLQLVIQAYLPADSSALSQPTPAAAGAAPTTESGDTETLSQTNRPQKRQKLSEAQLLPAKSEASALAQAPIVLAEFPAHRLILCKNDYFRSQVQRWQESTGSSVNSSNRSSSSHLPRVTWTLDSPDHTSAAVQVIAAMYGLEDSFKQLDQQQLVYAVLLADMLQETDAVLLARRYLRAAALSAAGLSAAALASLASAPAWPSCMWPVLTAVLESWVRISNPSGGLQSVLAAPNSNSICQILLTVLGDLEQVWMDEALQQVLMALPLQAMQLLLSSDELQVASEDTVLHTVRQYMRKYAPLPGDRLAEAWKQLSVLIRCPRLSRFWLCALALSPAADIESLKLPQAHKLLALWTLDNQLPVELIQKEILSVPPSWLLGPRHIKPLPGPVMLVWKLPISELKELCQRSSTSNRTLDLTSTLHTPPLGGLSWQLTVQACVHDWYSGGNDSVKLELGVFCGPVDVITGVYYNFDSVISVSGTHMWARVMPPHPIATGTGWGDADFFGLSWMPGGWDDAAWASQGLPLDGELQLELQVNKVY